MDFNPRLARLASEYTKLMNLAGRSQFIKIEPLEYLPGWPPEKYLITYTCKGIAGIEPDGNPISSDFHQVQMYMGSDYPQRQPYLRWLTPIWHPNIQHEEPRWVCAIAAQNWYAAKSLADLVVAMGEMVQYKRYHAKWGYPYPLNQIVADWVLNMAEPRGIVGLDKPWDRRLLVRPRGIRNERQPKLPDQPTHGISFGSRSKKAEATMRFDSRVIIDDALKEGGAELDLSGLGLTELPESIGELKQLRKLNLSGNRLTRLPESIGQLTRLEYLDLSNNVLETLPDSLPSLGSLEALFLHGNSALSLPAEILGPISEDVHGGRANPTQPAGILEYYYRGRGGTRSLNEAKLILVGRGGVGKTSIVNRLVHDIFRAEQPTDGIRITKWDVGARGNESVRLNVWDFGGQEIMHATHQFFLTRRSLYLLVLNGREGVEDADADYWLKLIESFGEDSPVIVVLNRVKEYPFDLNRRALEKKYSSIRCFIATDCEDGTGVAQLRLAIERETNGLEHLRDAFPKRWFDIKERLAGMTSNYLSFDEFREECSRFGEKDPASQEALSSYLHSLGTVVNYKDDPRLKDTHVLNPHWVTSGIYKILNSERLRQQGGEILLSQLPEMLDGDNYPAKTHRFLLDLMKKFELCFSFPGDDCHYLIPELLDKQEPYSASTFDQRECLNFQYHYPVLPEGLLPRFIVRTQVLSEGSSRWRTGVILSFEGNRALVKGDLQDRKVYISVQGPSAGRRRLLAIIRSDFERIHHDIRNLNPPEMIPLPDYPEVLVSFQELLVMERHEVKGFKKVVGDQVFDLDVDELLNGIDLDVSRRRVRAAESHANAVQLFYSYSHKDEGLRNELETHLKLLQREGLLETWHDRRIEAGDDWRERIDENLERADVVLLLVSPDFIASDYCFKKEMGRALERQSKEETVVIPVIVRDTNWKIAPFSRLQALPRNGQAVTTWANKDSAWRNVSEGIEIVVKEIQKRSASQ